MSGHTPGPWEVKQWPGGRVSVGHVVDGSHVAIAVVLPMDHKGERAANASVLGASLEMLAALKEIAGDHWRYGGDAYAEMQASARAAIAKATLTCD